jgi:hypothetical protein
MGIVLNRPITAMMKQINGEEKWDLILNCSEAPVWCASVTEKVCVPKGIHRGESSGKAGEQ